jgi:hypothetical protein
MGCRFPPDLRSPADLWRFVAGEGDGISPFPDDRGWGAVSVPDGGAHATPEPTVCQGGFVAGADRFDAEFFGIAEHEALAMDPQQRLLLETAWEAAEHAGLDPVGLRGTQTGVYAGVSYCHYGAGPQAVLPAGVEDQLIVGGTPSTTSGRVAYVMGLRGSAISIDTACSSSLVAIHLACQGLRRGDCDLALAGGVTIMATPNVILVFGRRGAVAGDGRCKPFSAAADGDRGRGRHRHLRRDQDGRPAPTAELGQIEHRPYPDRVRGGERDQDGHVHPLGNTRADAPHRPAVHLCRLVRRDGRTDHRVGSVAGRRWAPAGRRACPPSASAAPTRT